MSRRGRIRPGVDLTTGREHGIVVEPMFPGDWGQVRRIFLEGIATGNATFETQPPDWATWHGAHRAEARLVAREAGRVLGWAAISPVSSRAAYRGVAEVSVYVGATARGRGIGRSLLTELVRQSEAAGVWTLQAAIFPENAASIALHRRCGFRKVGVRKRLGRLAGVWRDVVLLERRSRVVGRTSTAS